MASPLLLRGPLRDENLADAVSILALTMLVDRPPDHGGSLLPALAEHVRSKAASTSSWASRGRVAGAATLFALLAFQLWFRYL